MKKPEKFLWCICLFVLFAGSCIDFFDIAWGTGIWLGELALSWAIILIGFCAVLTACFILLLRLILSEQRLAIFEERMISLRNRLHGWRWILLALVFIIPIWFLQFSVFGIVFKGLYLRVILWALELFLLSFLLTSETRKLLSWKAFLFSLILTATTFSVLASFKFVTSYPFSLGWSEGNRLWDYSVLFGGARYDYPAGREIPVLLDLGRQLVGGLPFLIPGLTISMERAWIALTSILPYIFLGLAAFRSFSRERYIWIAAVLWTYLFLKQGPIHAPLVLCAVLVALAWRGKVWLSGPLVAGTTAAAYLSRYTWTFAPGIWFILLELLDELVDPGRKFHLTPRIRSFILLLAGAMVAFILALAILFYFQPFRMQELLELFGSLEISPDNVREKISQQALLWYRLLPNETYGTGILAGLIFAVAPLILVLIHLLRTGIWALNALQKWVSILLLSAFLIVGLIISTKIGGGGDLHNMDMFLIGLFFVTVVAFHHGGRDWLLGGPSESLWVRVMITLCIAIPAITPLQEMRSYQFGRFAPWLVALTDAPNERALDMYPSDAVIERSLNTIQHEVDAARTQGEVLFMDQRQLLTFGFIEDVPLVPDYDKKLLIESALTKDREYFQQFYTDLQQGRFSLIIIQPLNTPRKGSDYEFGEENNAWVRWVANPLLCYYEIEQTLVEVNVQLLVPRGGVVDCAEVLP